MKRASIIAGLILAAGGLGAYAADGPDGKALYKAKCASCHGADGKGNEKMAKMFKVEPASLDLTSKAALDKDDAMLGAILSKGRGKMPAFAGKLDDAQSAAVLAAVRGLGSGKAAPAAAGGDAAKLYASKCASCHGKDGAGSPAMAKMFKVDAAALSLTKAESLAKTDEDLAGVIAKGQGKMPAYDGKLSAEETKGVIGYMRSLAKPSEK